MTHVRVCDPAASASCTSWLFEGDVAHGAPQEICGAGASLTYQERDAASNAWSPPTEARCDGEFDVEL